MGGAQSCGALRSGGIAVHRVERAARGPAQNCRRVTATAKGAIEVGAPVLRSEERQALLKQDWDVAGHAAVCE